MCSGVRRSAAMDLDLGFCSSSAHLFVKLKIKRDNPVNVNGGRIGELCIKGTCLTSRY